MKRLPYVVMLVVGIPIGSSQAAAQTSTSAPSKHIAHFRLTGPIEESPDELQLFAGPERARSLRELLQRLDQARTDPHIVAAVLELQEPQMGWAQIQELVSALQRFKQADKELFCFLEEADASTYLLAAAGGHITLDPSGLVAMTGIYGEVWYFKGLLDKLGLQADMEQIGPYKGAAEPLTRTEPSEQVKQQLDWIFDDLYQQMVLALVELRGLTQDRALQVIDRGWFTAEQARQAGLVDELASQQDFCQRLQTRYGPDVKLVHNYGVRAAPDIDLSSPFGLLRMLGEVIGGTPAPTKPVIGLIYIDGLITTGKSRNGMLGVKQIGSATIGKALQKARDDESVKAVVLRVDSPGGSAIASDVIFNAVRHCGQAKPVIVSMGNVAGSGGYYVAAAGDPIFAEPGTITGSIGVIGGKLVLAGLLEKIGISTYSLKRGQRADLFADTQRFGDEERALLRELLEDACQRFKQRVVQARRERLKADIEQLAGGRIYTGRQAVENGLVDRLGGLADALELAASQAGLVEYDVQVMPPPRTILDLLREVLGFGPQDPDDEDIAPALLLPAAEPMVWLQQLPPRQIRCVGRLLQRMNLLAREAVLSVMPYEIYWP